MSIKAKVTRSAVSKFKDAVVDAKAFSGRFENCEHCLSQMQKYISAQIDTLEVSIAALDKAKAVADKKIKDIETLLSRLEGELERTEAELSEVEATIANTPETFTYSDDEGNTHTVANPVYVALCAEAASLREKLLEIQNQIAEAQRRLSHARSVVAQIAAHTDSIRSVIFSLREKSSDCAKLIAETATVRMANTRQSTAAYELLCKIERIIIEYLDISIQLEESIAYDRISDISAAQLVGISFNLNITQVVNNPIMTSDVENAVRETDDNGKQYRIGDELIRNNKFQINGYQYETDNQGRTIVATGKLSINELGQKNRNMSDRKDVIGKGDEQESDDRGHLIGHQFNGSDRMENLVPQHWKINRGHFKDLENALADKVKAGQEVWVSVVPFYGNDTRRPVGIFYFYNIDGVPNIVLFPNDVTEEEEE